MTRLAELIPLMKLLEEQEKLGNYDSALDLYRQALQLQPTNPYLPAVLHRLQQKQKGTMKDAVA